MVPTQVEASAKYGSIQHRLSRHMTANSSEHNSLHVCASRVSLSQPHRTKCSNWQDPSGVQSKCGLAADAVPGKREGPRVFLGQQRQMADAVPHKTGRGGRGTEETGESRRRGRQGPGWRRAPTRCVSASCCITRAATAALHLFTAFRRRAGDIYQSKYSTPECSRSTIYSIQYTVVRIIEIPAFKV